MEEPNQNNDQGTSSIEDSNSDYETIDLSLCQNIKHFYMELVESGASEIDILIELAFLQYHCTARLIENQNEESSYVNQQVILQKKIMDLTRKVKPRLFEIDEYSATAFILFLNDFNQIILEVQSNFKVNLAQSVAYYLKYLLRDKSSRIRSKRSIGSSKGGGIDNPFSVEFIERRIDYAHYYRLFQANEIAIEGVAKTRNDSEKRVFVENLLRFAGELLDDKITIDTRVNDRVIRSLFDLLKSIEPFVEFRDLVTHGRFCREIELDTELVNQFIQHGLSRIRKATLILINKIQTDHIAEMLEKCGSENLKSWLTKEGLGIDQLEKCGLAGIKTKFEDITDKRHETYSYLNKDEKKKLDIIFDGIKNLNNIGIKISKPELLLKEKNNLSIKIVGKKLNKFNVLAMKQNEKFLTDEIMGGEIQNLMKPEDRMKLKGVINTLSVEMHSKGIKGDARIRDLLSEILSDENLRKGVDIVKADLSRILVRQKNALIEKIQRLEILPDGIFLSLHDVLTKITDLEGSYNFIDWTTEKGSLKRLKEVEKRIKTFGNEVQKQLVQIFREKLDDKSIQTVTETCVDGVYTYRCDGNVVENRIIEELNELVEKKLNSIKTSFFDATRNSISHVDITKDGEMKDISRIHKNRVLEVYMVIIKREGTNISKMLFEREINSIKESKPKKLTNDEKVKESFIELTTSLCEEKSTPSPKPKISTGRKLLAIIQFSGKGCLEIEEVKKFAEVDDEHKITSIDSEKILSVIEEAHINDIGKVHMLVDLTQRHEVTGKVMLTIVKLGEVHEQYSTLKRVGRISSHIAQNLMGISFINDLQAGDFKHAAISATFIASCPVLSKISDIAYMKGVTYISEGKSLLGKFLKLGSPFISRGASVLFVYDVYNLFNKYNHGKDDALIPAILGSTQVGVDLVTLGVEVGELAGLSGFAIMSAVLGPISESIGLVVLVLANVYSAAKTVEKIDEKILLTGMEIFEEGLRAFMGIGIKESLDIAIEEKDLNNQVVEGIVNFLRDNSHIKRAIFPSMSVHHEKMYSSEVVAGILYWGLRFTSPIMAAKILSPKFDWYNTCYPVERIFKPYSDNEVFLDKKLDTNELRWIRGAPGQPDMGKIYFAINDDEKKESKFMWLEGDKEKTTEGKIFCIPSAEVDVITPTEKTYRSKNAIGVKYNKNREGKATFINLTEGINRIIGFSNKPNIFAIGQGYKHITGGESDDLFKFVDKSIHHQSPYITGLLDGRGGIDTLDVNALPSEISIIFMNFQEQNLRDIDNKLGLEVKNMNNFIGRSNKIDTVHAACDTRHIDTRGGVNDSNYDTITITDNSACEYNTNVIIRPYTKVDSKPQEGVIRYIINEEEVGAASVNIDANLNCIHIFIFAYYTLSDISSIEIQESSISFSFSVSNSKFKLLIDGRPTTYSYQLRGSTKLIVEQNNLYALHNTQELIDCASIKRYSDIAKKLKMNLVVHSNDEVLSVGHEHHDVMQNDPLAKVSHLVGNGGENIFIVKPGVDIRNLSPVFLYNFNREETTSDTLDLREINKQVEELLKDELVSSVSEIGMDLEVIFSTRSSEEIIKIILKDALENDWYKMLEILINGLLIIKKTGDSFKLLPKPLIFKDKYKITYVISPADVERENSIEIKKSISKYVFARDGNTLVITNALRSSTNEQQSSADELFTVLLNNFYINDKMKTLNIKFDNNEVVLAKEINEIMKLNDENDFHDRIEQFRVDSYASVLNHPATYHRIMDLSKKIQQNSDKDALNIQVKPDYKLQQVAYNHDEHLKKGEIIVENLLSAIRNGDEKWLIEHESDLNIKDQRGKTLLHIAAFKGYLNVIEYLAYKHADIYAKDNDDKTMMHYAAHGGKIKIIKYLIDKYVEVDSKSKDGRTPLQYSAGSGNILTMRYLIDQGADLHAVNRDHVTTLHYASEGSNVNVIEYLLKQGFDINVYTDQRRTPLHYAAQIGSLDVIKYLVKHGADIAATTSLGNTVLHLAVERGDVEIVSYLLNQGIDINTKNHLGNTPLHSASMKGNLDVVSYLEEKGANINIENRNGQKAEDILKKKGGNSAYNNQVVFHSKYTNLYELVESIFDSIVEKDNSLFINRNDISQIRDQSGGTLLHAAASKGYMVVVKYLIESAGAEVDSIDSLGRTPLYSAIFNDKLEVVKYLVGECRANIFQKDNNQESPLYFAVLNARVLIVKYLLEQGADVDAEDQDKKTPLHLAIYHDKEELARYLIVKGKANVNAFDINGNTPMHYSSMKGDFNMVRYLVDKGADIYEKNNAGKTPLDMLRENDYDSADIIRRFKLNVTMIDAVKHNDMKKVQELIGKGAKINIRDKLGQTLIYHAVSNNHISMARYLVNYGADISSVNGLCPMVSNEGDVVSMEPCATDGASSLLMSDIMSRVKRSISGFFGYSAYMDAGVNSPQSTETRIYAAPVKIERDIPRIDMKNNHCIATTGSIDLHQNLFLINVLVRKMTGEKFVPSTSSNQYISEREAMAHSMSITHGFEKALKKAAKASKTKIPQDKLGYQLYMNVHPIVTASIVKNEYDKIGSILHSAAMCICPEGKKNFSELVNIEIKDMLTHTESQISSIESRRNDKLLFDEGQTSLLVNPSKICNRDFGEI